MPLTQPRSVRTLLGESTLDVSLTCLPTLIRYSSDPVRLVVHEDGSLTKTGRDALREALPGVEFIDREQADDEMTSRLRGYSRCLAARAANVFFLKLFDVALMERGELFYSDSDILYLRPFTGLFAAGSDRYRAIFMTDAREAYSIRPWQLRPLGRIRLAGRVNTGLMRVKPGIVDLDFIEWLLKRVVRRSVWARRFYWNEQTCWAALAGRTACGLWDGRQVAMATRDMTGHARDAVAIHFCSIYRGYLKEYAVRARPHTGPPVEVESHAARWIGPVDQYLSDFRGRLRP